MSGFGRIALLGSIVATVAGIAGLRAQTQLADPKDAPKIFASTCSACHKSPQGLAKSGQVAGFLRQHYTTGPEMSAAMAAYLVAAGSGPARKDKDRDKAAAAGQPGEKAKSKKQEQAAAQPGAPGADAKDRVTLRGKQLTKSQDDRTVHAPVHPSTASATDAAARQTAVSAPAAAAAEAPMAPAPAAETTPPPVVFDIPLPDLPTAPPADLTQSAFSSSPLP